ncbi:glycosyltransferase family 2 protein, partial [bacterium]|nr:glycosyltransferase family 2 protein [bacterium]
MSDYEISVIIPVFNEEGNLQELYKRLRYVLEEEMGVTYEILFVEDGYDSSWKIIKSMHEENDHIKGIRFSRRFGHQCALKAGLDYAQGKAVISMDADLQHPPELIVELYEKWKEGYQIVQTVRKDTIGGNLFKKITSILFYR